MTDADMIEFIDFLNNASDAEVIQLLRETNRIDENNLELAASLLRKIVTNDGRLEVLTHLARDKDYWNGVPGAIDPAYMLLQPQTIAELTYVYANDITGGVLYCLYNDCGKRDFTYFMLNIWAMMSGVYSQKEINDNFQNYASEDDVNNHNWFTSRRRNYFRPFVYNDTVINISDYVKDIHKFEPTDEGFKNFVQANRYLNLLMNYLAQCELKLEGFKFTQNDNLEISIHMPVEDESYFPSVWTQSRTENLETFAVDTNQIAQLAVYRPKAKFFNQLTKSDLCKSLYFLKHAKKQFLPGLTVIRSMPLDKIENFYINNNDKRYGEIIKNGKFDDLYSQVGIFKLGYLLGLFNTSENDSKVASDYIQKSVIGRVPIEDIHKLYGGLDISEGFKKEFAEFFMIHHSMNIHCFEDSQGTDKTAQIYHYFDAILKFRPEKTIKTTTNRERLTPEDAISALKSGSVKFGLPVEYDAFVEVLSKYTSNVNEMLWIIERLLIGQAIPQEEITIPYIEDKGSGLYKFRVLKKGDAEIGICGKKTNCCFEYKNASQSSLEHALISPNSSVVVFESDNSYIQGWIWYDAENSQLVIDNLEGRCENKRQQELVDALLRFADKAMIAMNKKGNACASVNLGTGYLKPSIVEVIERYIGSGQIKKCEKPNIDYVREFYLYTDADEQYVLSNAELAKSRSVQNKNFGE